MLCAGGIAQANALVETAQLVGVQGIPSGLVTGILTQLAVFQKLSGGRIENQKDRRTWAVLLRQCFAEVCKAFYFCWIHIDCCTEYRKGQRFLSGL